MTAIATAQRGWWVRAAFARRTAGAGIGALLAVVGVSGCGEEPAPGTGVPTRDPPGIPALAARPPDTISSVRTAVREKDCAAMIRLIHSAYGPNKAALCSDLFRQLTTLPADAPVVLHGTGAVVDFVDRNDVPRALVLATDTNDRLRIVLVTTKKGSADPARARHAPAVARRGLRAIAAGDCTGFLRVASRSSGIGDAPGEEVCVALANLSVVPYLHSDPAARPESQGGDGWLAFHVLRVGRTTSSLRGVFTIITQRTSPPANRGAAEWKFVTVVPS